MNHDVTHHEISTISQKQPIRTPAGTIHEQARRLDIGSRHCDIANHGVSTRIADHQQKPLITTNSMTKPSMKPLIERFHDKKKTVTPITKTKIDHTNDKGQDGLTRCCFHRTS